MFGSKMEAAVLSRFWRLSSLIILLAIALGLSWPQAAAAEAPYLQYFRNRHTATVLANGQVLVTGGYGGPAYNPDNIPPQVLNVTELCDPVKGTWSYTQDLYDYRENHTATLLKNGKVLVAGGDDGFTTLGTVELYDPGLATWTRLGDLQTPRRGHTATLLDDGTVLFTGGMNDYGLLADAETYDPNAETSQTVPANVGRVYHTATLLKNGKVLVAGGVDANNYLRNTAEIYDPATRTWSSASNMNYYRAGHTATLLTNGQVLLAAGDDGVDNKSSELFDPAAGKWSLTKDPKTGNQTFLVNGTRFHAATLLTNGQVLVTGGEGSEIATEIYDPNSQTWAYGNLLTFGRAGHTATPLASGYILLVGGYSSIYIAMGAELFYPNQGEWLDLASSTILPLKPRELHTATLLPGGQVMVAGGWDGQAPMSSTQVIYNVSETNPYFSWIDTAPLYPARYYHTATLLPCGQVLAAGGRDATAALGNVQVYDPAKGTWRPTQPLKQARYLHTATLLTNGKVLVTGGLDSAGKPLASAELYNPATGAWTLLGPMRHARSWHTATLLLNGQVLVVGGLDAGSKVVAEVELFDPVTQTWSLITTPMATPRCGHTATLLPNGKVLAAGGVDSSSTVLNTAELYDPEKKTWAKTGDLHNARLFHTATILPEGLVLAAGGTSSFNSFSAAYAELFDPAQGIWLQTYRMGMMNTQRYRHTATLLNHGEVLVTGGYTEVVDSEGNKVPVILGAVEVYENWFGIKTERNWIKEVKIIPPPPGYQDMADPGVFLGITLNDLMPEWMKSHEGAQTQQVQVQLLSVENKLTYIPTIDPGQSKPTFLVARVSGAAKDIFQVTVCIGGVPSIALIIQMGPGAVPPCLSITPVMQMLMD